MAAVVLLLCAAASVKVMANPSVQRPVAQFIYFYGQSDASNLWERVIYSVLLTNTATSSEQPSSHLLDSFRSNP
jgi:hypothetical protein